MNRLFAGLARRGFRSTTAALLALLVAINALAVGTLLSARARVRDAADRELALRTDRVARSIEASLASTRGDLLFFAQSGSVRRLAESAADPDPFRSRWNRLDAEGAGLLFLRSHPVIARLVLTDAGGTPLLSVGRRGGAPIAVPAPDAGDLPVRTVRLPEGEVLDVRVLVALEPREMAGLSAADDTPFRIETRSAASPDPSAAGDHVASAAITDRDWDPPVEWTLHARENEGELLRSVQHLAAEYRNTLLLNAALIVLASLLGWMALREVRVVERLQAEQEQAARVRALELGLLHRDRLAALGRMAAGIAHEINNPLEGMSNYLRLAEEDLGDGRTDEAGRHLRAVGDGLERVASVVRQTLNQAGDGRGAKERVDLAEIAARTVEFAREDARAQGVRIRIDPPEAAVPVPGNRTTLGQLILNLLLNACEAQPDGGEVDVRCGRDADGAWVRVEDRGPGLPADAERLFEPFFSTKESTGLGLFLCHGIAADHGGTLAAENRSGGGARFTLRLPNANPEKVT